MWKLIREESRLGNRAAQSWTQKIEVTGDHISVHEEIVFGGRDAMKTTFVAAFDGKNYQCTVRL
ncbi:MAG TPA: hypothetical protein VJ756_00265 [Terriglobales bacterium]|nr:hypothetical protein [Terriglobales bacterium]